MRNKKILLVDTNYSAKPIFDYLTKTGNKVFVVGGNKNDFLAKISPNYCEMNYSEVQSLSNLVSELEIDYLVPGCNDVSYTVCAQLNSEENKFFGLDTIQNTELLINKSKFRAFASKVGLSVPETYPIDQIPNNKSIIIKPVDAYSGRGITIFKQPDVNSLQSAIEKAKSFSRSKNYVIEEFVSGQLYSHSAFIVNNSIVEDFIVIEHATANQFVVDTSHVVYNFPQEVLSEIRKQITTLAKELKLENGLLHTQFIHNGDNFWIIEITKRCPGDLYSLLVEDSTGVPYAEMYAKSFLGEEVIPRKKIKKKNILRHTISFPKENRFCSLKFNIPVKIEKFIPLTLAGDMLKASPYSRMGLIFLNVDTETELEELKKTALSRTLYSIES